MQQWGMDTNQGNNIVDSNPLHTWPYCEKDRNTRYTSVMTTMVCVQLLSHITIDILQSVII